jgi:two-component system phosphate regulon response regulator PhoB
MSESSTFTPPKHSILVIDDEPDLCELIEFQLQKEGFRTSSLSNPLEAIGHARELIARSKAILARTLKKKLAMSGKLEGGGIVLDPESHEVFIEEKLVDLTHTEFRLLHLMMERIGRVQSRENLLVNVWNYDSDIETRTVDNHVGRLRGKLGDKGDMIKTVRGVGYKLVID